MPEPNYGNFVQIPENTFSELVVESGLLLDKFDISGTTPIQNADILCATTGGVSATCVPSFIDNGEDVDNCPNNMAELKDVDTWECKLAFTGLNATPKMIQMGIGPADVTGNKVTPSMTLKSEHFQDIWLVVKRRDGGYAAVHLKNALSTAGLTLQTTKKAKGQFSYELTGHFSINSQDTVPMEWYAQEGPTVATAQNNTQEGEA